jgi:sialate O-acetylesterase
MNMIRRFLCFVAFLPLPLAADVKLPAIISDHMLIQQQMPVRVWGSAAPGEKVAADFKGQHLATNAAQAG